MLRREGFHFHLGVVSNFRNVELLVHGLASRIDDRAVWRGTAGHGRKDNEREFEVGYLTRVAVHQVHEHAAAGLNFRETFDPRGVLVGVGAASTGDRTGDADLLEGPRLDQDADGGPLRCLGAGV